MQMFWLEVDYGEDGVNSGNYGLFSYFPLNSEDYEMSFDS